MEKIIVIPFWLLYITMPVMGFVVGYCITILKQRGVSTWLAAIILGGTGTGIAGLVPYVAAGRLDSYLFTMISFNMISGIASALVTIFLVSHHKILGALSVIIAGYMAFLICAFLITEIPHIAVTIKCMSLVFWYSRCFLFSICIFFTMRVLSKSLDKKGLI